MINCQSNIPAYFPTLAFLKSSPNSVYIYCTWMSQFFHYELKLPQSFFVYKHRTFNVLYMRFSYSSQCLKYRGEIDIYIVATVRIPFPDFGVKVDISMPAESYHWRHRYFSKRRQTDGTHYAFCGKIFRWFIKCLTIFLGQTYTQY